MLHLTLVGRGGDPLRILHPVDAEVSAPRFVSPLAPNPGRLATPLNAQYSIYDVIDVTNV